MTTSPQRLSEDEFPAVYRAADKNSLDGQRRFLASTKIRLGALIAASVFGVLTSVEAISNGAAILAAISFGGALVAELFLLKTRPDRTWYDGRAGAESAKTLTWRFVVGGRPFGKEDISDLDAEALLLERLREIVRNLKGIALVPPTAGADQITPAMLDVRSLSLEQRREEYLANRIENQRDWYASKAQWNEKQATGWMVGLGVGEAAALVGAVLMAADVINVDLLGLAAALVAAGAAWIQTKQYQNLASAYSVASHELSDIGSRAKWATTESDWAHFVDQSEEAISREHTMWRASRA